LKAKLGGVDGGFSPPHRRNFLTTALIADCNRAGLEKVWRRKLERASSFQRAWRQTPAQLD
jgi:hypothetical protein